MSVVLANDGTGRALIFDRATGEVLRCSVPTAVENVGNGAGRFVHGEVGEPLALPESVPAAPSEPAASLTLVQDDVLPLPAGEVGIAETAIVQPAEMAAPAVDPLDHDANGRKGGSKPAADGDERAAVIAALKAKGVKFFAGASTEKLKAKLAES